MKLRVAREGNGLLGLFWCGATRELSLNFTRRSGLRLRLAFTEQQNGEINAVMLNVLEEKARLRRLSNERLVDEVLSTSEADSELVLEMADRLDPGWENRVE